MLCVVVGSKFLQVNYKMTVSVADAYMLLPEGAMVVLSPLFGLYLDKANLSLPAKLKLLAGACFGLGVSYIMLSYGFVPHNSGAAGDTHAYFPTVLIPPLISMVCVGIAYGLSNSTLWSTMMFVISKESHILSVSSLMSCSLNFLPAILPILIVACSRKHGFHVEDGNDNVEVADLSRRGLLILTLVSWFASVFAYISSSKSSLLIGVSHNAASVEQNTTVQQRSKSGQQYTKLSGTVDDDDDDIF
jgi:hypothetical protein